MSERGPTGPKGERGATGLTGKSTRLATHIPFSFAVLTTVFALLLGGLAWQILANRHLAQDGLEAHDALCVFKADLERRYQNGKEFFVRHPTGFAGMSPTTLANSLRNQQATLESLDRLDCVPPPDPMP